MDPDRVFRANTLEGTVDLARRKPTPPPKMRAFGHVDKPYAGINAAERSIYVVPSHTPQDQVLPGTVIWGAPPRQHEFVSYALTQSTLSVSDRDLWAIKVDHGRPKRCFKIAGVVQPGQECSYVGGTYPRDHHGILFRQIVEPEVDRGAKRRKIGPLDKYFNKQVN